MKENNKVYVAEVNGDDPLTEFKDLVVECTIRDRPKPIYGRLERITPQYLTLRRLHGTATVINRDAVEMVQPTKANYSSDVV